MSKFYNDAIIGNKEMKASFTEKGELIRLYYPNTDYRQFIDFFHAGVKINDSSIIYLHNDINNIYNQYYTENTNILNTEIINTYFKLKILQTDFICTDKNILVKKYKMKNENNIDLNINFIIHSGLLTDDNNQVSGYYKENALFQYMHDYTFAVCSDRKIKKSQINNSNSNIETGIIGDKDYVGMSSNSSISYEIKTLKPNEEIELSILITVFYGSDIKISENKINKIRNIDAKKELEKTKKYWEKFVKEHSTIKLTNSNTEYMKKIEQIYKRTILLYPLLINDLTGGISAAIEIDEDREKCGRYSYCWPRDRNIYYKRIRHTRNEKRNRKILQNILQKHPKQIWNVGAKILHRRKLSTMLGISNRRNGKCSIWSIQSLQAYKRYKVFRRLPKNV